MKSIALPILFLFCFLSGQPLWGQFAFQITAPGVQGFPAIAEEDDVDSISFFVRNTGNAPFGGDLYTFQRVSGSGPFPVDTLTIPSLNPGDSILIDILDYEFESNLYALGSNPVIIWVTDDNFSAVSNEDTSNVFIFRGPAFGFGQSGFVGFPLMPVPSNPYAFDIHVRNISEDDYNSRLFTHFAVNGDTHVVASDSTLLPGESSFFLNIDYTFLIPPYAPNLNQLQVWVQGDSGAVAVDTAYFTIDFTALNRPHRTASDLIRTFPNPATGDLNIVLPPEVKARRLALYNAEGSLVREMDGNAYPYQWNNLYQLPPGAYILRVEMAGNKVWFKKILLRNHN